MYGSYGTVRFPPCREWAVGFTEPPSHFILLPRHFLHIRRLLQPRLGKAVSRRIVEKDALFLRRPHRVDFQQAWTLDVEGHSAWFPRPQEQGFLHGTLGWVEAVAGAKRLVDVIAEFGEGGKGEGRGYIRLEQDGRPRGYRQATGENRAAAKSRPAASE